MNTKDAIQLWNTERLTSTGQKIFFNSRDEINASLMIYLQRKQDAKNARTASFKAAVDPKYFVNTEAANDRDQTKCQEAKRPVMAPCFAEPNTSQYASSDATQYETKIRASKTGRTIKSFRELAEALRA